MTITCQISSVVRLRRPLSVRCYEAHSLLPNWHRHFQAAELSTFCRPHNFMCRRSALCGRWRNRIPFSCDCRHAAPQVQKCLDLPNRNGIRVASVDSKSNVLLLMFGTRTIHVCLQNITLVAVGGCHRRRWGQRQQHSTISLENQPHVKSCKERALWISLRHILHGHKCERKILHMNQKKLN